MALDAAALTDLRNYTRRRLKYLRYYVGSKHYDTPITDAQILTDGTVRIQATIVPSSAVNITRVELYNNNGNRWAYQDANITIDVEQTGVLYWFDFTIKEGKV